MTETPPPERRFWQIHLSTAVVMMVAAGGIIWLNTIALNNVASPSHDPGVWYSNDEDRWTHPYVSEQGVPFHWGWKIGYGWPFVALLRNTQTVNHGVPSELTGFEIQWSGAIRNLGIAAAILMLSCCCVEYLIRRRSYP